VTRESGEQILARLRGPGTRALRKLMAALRVDHRSRGPLNMTLVRAPASGTTSPRLSGGRNGRGLPRPRPEARREVALKLLPSRSRTTPGAGALSARGAGGLALEPALRRVGRETRRMPAAAKRRRRLRRVREVHDAGTTPGRAVVEEDDLLREPGSRARISDSRSRLSTPRSGSWLAATTTVSNDSSARRGRVRGVDGRAGLVL